MFVALNEGGMEAIALIAGILSGCVRPLRRYVRKRGQTFDGPCWQSQRVVMDFLNGATAVPFALLAASALYPHIATVLVANKNTLSVAGAIGLIFVVGEILTAGRDD